MYHCILDNNKLECVLFVTRDIILCFLMLTLFPFVAPRQCIVCGRLAKFECRECFDDCSNAGLESTAFCLECLRTVHRHEKRKHHRPSNLEVSPEFSTLQDVFKPPRLYMELFAVICIETSHYVAFVKCGVGHEAPWCFFDSMADRQGELLYKFNT